MNPTYDFAGQVPFVTGASSGTGLAIARAFAESGAAVTLADINRDALQAATDTLTKAGHRVLDVPCDAVPSLHRGSPFTIAQLGAAAVTTRSALAIRSCPEPNTGDKNADTIRDDHRVIRVRGGTR
jgi:NAD(P)-dependent dehydrogenase (short-subunit alcohol dehydrogenase family)